MSPNAPFKRDIKVCKVSKGEVDQFLDVVLAKMHLNGLQTEKTKTRPGAETATEKYRR
jgi:cell division septum initiation protein DivIVA